MHNTCAVLHSSNTLVFITVYGIGRLHFAYYAIEHGQHIADLFIHDNATATCTRQQGMQVGDVLSNSTAGSHA